MAVSERYRCQSWGSMPSGPESLSQVSKRFGGSHGIKKTGGLANRRRASVSIVAMEPVIAVFNAGSSSLKFAFYEGGHRILSGQVDGIGERPAEKASAADGTALEPPNLASAAPTTPSDVLPVLIPWAKEKLGGRRLAALGHRGVHGGMRRVRPERITRELLAELEALIPLAPFHQAPNLNPIP